MTNPKTFRDIDTPDPTADHATVVTAAKSQDVQPQAVPLLHGRGGGHQGPML